MCTLLAAEADLAAARSPGPAAAMSPSNCPTMSLRCSRKSLPTCPVIVSWNGPCWCWDTELVLTSIFTAISIQNYIDPGAGLKHLEDWVQDSDLIFDSLFMNSTGPALGNGFNSDVSGTGTPAHVVPMVRSYQSDAAM